MATQHNIQEIQSSKGGNQIALVELSTSFAIPGTLTADTNCIDLGHLKESGTAINTTVTKLKNEAMEVVRTEKDYEGITRGVLMQTSKRVLDFMAFTVRDKTYLQYKKPGINKGQTQEIFAIGEATPQMNLQNPGAAENCPYEFTHLVSDTAYTFTTTNLAAIEAALGISIACTTNVTIPAGQEYVMYETA